jgi:hypothetical protein
VTDFPHIRTARQLVDEGILPAGISERSFKALAKTHNVGRKMGRAYVFTPDDVKALLSRLPCLSNSRAEKIRETGTYAGLSEDAKLTKARALITSARLKTSGSGAKRNSSTPRSTAKVLPIHSRMQP